MVDKLLRRGDDIEALNYVDDIVLKGYLGLKENMIIDIRRAWEELRNRRINRR
jgi:hypothetical protein